MMCLSFGIRLMMRSALLEVQMMSLSALISAEQLIYVTTIASGYWALNFLKASGGQESAKEQPALRSGKSTFFVGLTILAVSAIKCTPANTMMSALVFAACCAR